MLCTTPMRNAGSFSTYQPASDSGISQMSFGVASSPLGGPNGLNGTQGAVAATKRERDDSEGSSSLPRPLQVGQSFAATPLQHEMPQQPPPPPPSSADSSVSSKRSRTSNYQAPREVRPSILSAMGSLVGGVQSGSSTSVPQRRRLSGGYLDEFLGGHDNMDMDHAADSRPRSMSF